MKKETKTTVMTTCCSSNSKKETCGCHSSASETTPQTHLLKVDFLFLDLSMCSRCQTTESTLEKSLHEIAELLQTAGYEVQLNKIHIDSLEKAIAHQFISSPTIRVNGRDSLSKTLESNCQDCGDLCGGQVDCRDWQFEGVRYTEPPKPMLIQAILKTIYAPVSPASDIPSYEVPENIKQFFKLQQQKKKIAAR